MIPSHPPSTLFSPNVTLRLRWVHQVAMAYQGEQELCQALAIKQHKFILFSELNEKATASAAVPPGLGSWHWCPSYYKNRISKLLTSQPCHITTKYFKV